MLILSLSELFTKAISTPSAQVTGTDSLDLTKLYRMARGHDSLSPELAQELESVAGR